MNLLYINSYLIDESRRLKSKGVRSKLAITFKASSSRNKPKGNKLRCNYYKKLDYLKITCYQLYPEKKLRKKAYRNKKVNDDNLGSEIAAIAVKYALIIKETKAFPTWYLDSGATSHVYIDKEVFKSLEPYNIKLNWSLAGAISIKYRGIVKVEFISTRKRLTLNNCLYISEIGMNLLSLGRLLKNNILTEFDITRVSLRYNKKIIARGSNERNILVFKTTTYE